MKILCLTDFPVRPPDRWLWDYLPDQPDEVDFLWAGATDRSASWGKLVTRYPAYSRLALQALSQLNSKHYDVVVAWEASVGIPFALAARLRRRGVPPLVLLAFNPGDVPAIFQPLLALAYAPRWLAATLGIPFSAELRRQARVFQRLLAALPGM